jgi:hypothetical protein
MTSGNSTKEITIIETQKKDLCGSIVKPSIDIRLKKRNSPFLTAVWTANDVHCIFVSCQGEKSSIFSFTAAGWTECFAGRGPVIYCSVFFQHCLAFWTIAGILCSHFPWIIIIHHDLSPLP